MKSKSMTNEVNCIIIQTIFSEVKQGKSKFIGIIKVFLLRFEQLIKFLY